MEIMIATVDAAGNPLSPDEIQRLASAEVRRLRAIHCYSVRVNGKPIGANAAMPGLSIERARVLYAELLDSANRTDSVFLSSVRYKNFGIYKRDENGVLTPVAGCQYAPKSRNENRNRAPRWVR